MNRRCSFARCGALVAAVFFLACRREPTSAGLAPEQSAASVVSASTREPDLPPPPSASVSDLREYVARSHSAAGPREYKGSPEEFSKAMKGTIPCGKKRCRAGKELCVSSPGESYRIHCERIAEWLDHRTPKPERGFPPLAGLRACDGSHNCPEGSVCCLHELGMAEVQAIVCHAALDECRDREESCAEGVPQSCRTPGTRCEEYRCVSR